MFNIKGNKNTFVLILILLSGIIIGGFIGEKLGGNGALSFLRYGESIGVDNFNLNLGILVLNFGIKIKFTISGIIGMVISIFIYRKM